MNLVAVLVHLVGNGATIQFCDQYGGTITQGKSGGRDARNLGRIQSDLCATPSPLKQIRRVLQFAW